MRQLEKLGNPDRSLVTGAAGAGRRIQGLSNTVLSSLRCPTCRSTIELSSNEVCCPQCQKRYPIVDGVPILLNEDNSLFRISDAVPVTGPKREGGAVHRLVDRLLPRMGKNHSARRNLARMADMLTTQAPNPKVLEIGAGLMDDSLLFLTGRPGVEVVFTDVAVAPAPSFQHYRDPEASRVSVVCDGHDIPFADGSFDGVVAIAVLEHVLDPNRVAAEITRVVKPGGLVYAETPFMQQVHGGPYDFTRFTELGHRWLFRWFELIDSGPVSGPATALAWSWSHFLRGFTSTWGAYTAARVAGRVTGWWLGYFDRIIMHTRGGRGSASGYYFLGRRTEAPITGHQLLNSYSGL